MNNNELKVLTNAIEKYTKYSTMRTDEYNLQGGLIDPSTLLIYYISISTNDLRVLVQTYDASQEYIINIKTNSSISNVIVKFQEIIDFQDNEEYIFHLSTTKNLKHINCIKLLYSTYKIFNVNTQKIFGTIRPSTKGEIFPDMYKKLQYLRDVLI